MLHPLCWDKVTEEIHNHRLHGQLSQLRNPSLHFSSSGSLYNSDKSWARRRSLKTNGDFTMFQRKIVLGTKIAPLQKYDIIVDYCACMVSIALATHKVDANNVNIQWSAGQLSVALNMLSAFSASPNFYIDPVALMHGFLLFRRELTRRGIFVIDVYREDKAVPIFHHLKHSRTSLDVKFSSYFTPSISEEDLLSTIISLRNELLKRNKFEVSPYSSPSLVFGVIQLSMLQNQTTTVDVETNTVERTPAKMRKSPSDLTDRSIKNVTSKVITSVDGVVGEKNSLYFLKSAVKILDYRKRKHAVFLEDEQDHRGEEDNEDSDSQECDEYEAYMSDERLRTALDKIP